MDYLGGSNVITRVLKSGREAEEKVRVMQSEPEELNPLLLILKGRQWP